ncbi:hypothetical protein [uncultured Nostoc sp.]|uniref:hypothetical protein n=1 Tax=uncultured Nostoc sp. TaxID=340711 RepID=UPI002637C385|nr:hypothetical protein [uncultured Nostoc sp.]
MSLPPKASSQILSVSAMRCLRRATPTHFFNWDVKPFIFTPMNFPPQLQQKIEKWASSQGILTKQFILQAIAEKIDALTQQTAEATNVVSSNQPKVYRKEGILVVDAQLPENFDLNTFIDELREERIPDQMAL